MKDMYLKVIRKQTASLDAIKITKDNVHMLASMNFINLLAVKEPGGNLRVSIKENSYGSTKILGDVLYAVNEGKEWELYTKSEYDAKYEELKIDQISGEYING